MIPEHRLAVLLDEVKEGWIENCLFHNTSASPSLYLDHSCERDEFPLRTVQRLEQHRDEVWFLAFSHDGSMLATSGAEPRILIYETRTFSVIHTLQDHESGVCYLAFSPDDTKLISSSKEQDNKAIIWDLKVHTLGFS